MPRLRFGAFPATEDLALAVTAIRLETDYRDDEEDEMALANSYTEPELL